MEQRVKDLEKELEDVMLAIGKAKAGAGGDIDSLRNRKAEIEQEIEEAQAESAYREKEAAEAAKKAHQAAIKATLAQYDQAEEAFIESFSPVQKCLEKLSAVKMELDAAVEQFLAGTNPLQILRPIWKELPPDKQAELQRHVWDVFNVTPPVISAKKTCESVSGRFRLLSMSAGNLKVKQPKPSGPKKAGGATITKSDPVFVSPLQAKKMGEQRRKRAQIVPEKRNLNKPLIPEKRREGATVS